jgi:uncharacterized membrane protein YbaN (DUF454 family)
MASPKQTLKALEKAPPGERFRRIFQERQKSRHGKQMNVAFVIAGLVVIGIGVATYPVPVIPSEIVILIGLGLLSQGSRTGARLLDGAEVRLRRWLAPALKAWRRWPKWAKVCASIAWMALVSGLSYWIYLQISD